MLTSVVFRHLQGALLLLRFNARGFAMMDTTQSGAAFSFVAALVAVPLYVLMLAGDSVPNGTSELRYIGVQAISYIAQWAVMPLLLYYACIAMGKQAAWPRLVVAYNWLAVWQMVLGLLSSLWIDSANFAEGDVPVWLLLVGLYVIVVMGWLYHRVLQANMIVPLLLILLNVAVDWQLGLARFALLNNPPA